MTDQELNALRVEQWKSVVGFEGYYEVSDLGRVKRIAGGPGATIGRVLNPAVNRTGYPQVGIRVNGKGLSANVHTLVAAAFLGPVPRIGMPGHRQVNHKNGIKTDNRLENLEYVTAAENTRHAVTLGLNPRGSRNGQSKLTELQVAEIKAKRLSGVKLKELAEDYHVTMTAICSAVKGRNWKYTPKDDSCKVMTDDGINRLLHYELHGVPAVVDGKEVVPSYSLNSAWCVAQIERHGLMPKPSGWNSGSVTLWDIYHGSHVDCLASDGPSLMKAVALAVLELHRRRKS